MKRAYAAKKKAGKPWKTQSRIGRPPSEHVRVPVHLYALARNLRRAVRAHVMEQEGHIDDLALTATALVRELLGE
jgi:hypothetical protein